MKEEVPANPAHEGSRKATNATMDASDMDEDSLNESEKMEIFTQEDFDESIVGDNNGDSRSQDKDELERIDNPSTSANANDDNANDGESSVGSLSSSQSSSSLSSMASTSSEASLTLKQRQARNIARNERFLGSLREKYEGQLGGIQEQQAGKKKSTKGKGAVVGKEENCYDRTEDDLGMINRESHRLFRFPRYNQSQSNSTESPTLLQNYASGMRMLHERYPHRVDQIGKVHAILSSTASLTASVSSKVIPSSAASVYVPAPIFCIGPKGTGKTSIVSDILGLLSSHSQATSNDIRAKVQPAYVDCSIVEPSTVERLVYTIYKQLKPSSSTSMGGEKRKSRSRIKKNPTKRRKRKSSGFLLPDDSNSKKDGGIHPPATVDDETDEQPRVLPSRKAKKAAIHKSIAQNATTYKNLQKRRTGDKYDSSDTEDDEDDSDDEAVTTLHSAVLSLGRSLQKYYGSYLDDNGAYNNKSFRKKPKCGVLVLDKAEELLSLSSASKKGTSASTGGGANNFLSELLLLPKIMKLNLTIVVITNYCTLHMTRLNNASDPSKALGTISNGVHPIIVQFPAYKGNKIFTEILSTTENQKLVLGNSLSSSSDTSSTMRQSLKDKLIRTFWNTVVQFASDSTRDIRDFQRLGRALWPSFVAPLHPSVLKSTLTAAVNKIGEGTIGLTKKSLSDPERYTKMEDEVVRMMGKRFYPMVSSLASGDDSLTLLILNEDGSLPVIDSRSSSSCRAKIDRSTEFGTALSIPQPYLRSCLLLAAFVCQHNKADQDRKLFSVHGNGKRRKARAKEDLYGGNDEDLAFGSTNMSLHTSSGRGRKSKQDGQNQPRQVEMLRSLKLRPVPLERVFSIFVTLVRLNPGYDGMEDDEEGLEATMDDLGSSRLYRDLSHLIDIGYIQLTKGNQTPSLAPTKVLCTLTRDEALEISNRIKIPLERYLL